MLSPIRSSPDSERYPLKKDICQRHNAPDNRSQTRGGYAVVAAAEARWKAANPTYGREQYRTVIGPQVVERVDEIVRYFDNLSQERCLGFVANLCEERATDCITMFAMQWATVSDRIVSYL